MVKDLTCVQQGRGFKSFGVIMWVSWSFRCMMWVLSWQDPCICNWRPSANFLQKKGPVCWRIGCIHVYYANYALVPSDSYIDGTSLHYGVLPHHNDIWRIPYRCTKTPFLPCSSWAVDHNVCQFPPEEDCQYSRSCSHLDGALAATKYPEPLETQDLNSWQKFFLSNKHLLSPRPCMFHVGNCKECRAEARMKTEIRKKRIG